MKKENIFWDPATFKTNSTYNSVRVCSQEESSQVQNVCSRFGQLTFCKCVQDSNGINVTLTINWTETSWSLFSLHFKAFLQKRKIKVSLLYYSATFYPMKSCINVCILKNKWKEYYLFLLSKLLGRSAYLWNDNQCSLFSTLKILASFHSIQFFFYISRFIYSTDKRTDIWSRDFLIWKINFGLWAVAWAG